LKNRIIGNGKDSVTFSGEQHAAQVSTYVQEKGQADRLFQKVLDGYPSKAYNIKQPKPYRIGVDNYRRPMIIVSYELSWNIDFILSIRETLDAVEDCKNTWSRGCEYKITTIAKDPKDWATSVTKYFFSDWSKNNQLHNQLVTSTPRIIVNLYDISDKVIHTTCYNPKFISGGNEAFYSTGNQHSAIIYGNTVEAGYFGIMNVDLATIDKTFRLELSVQKGNCN
jgi:hypothetical protein